MKQIKCLVFAAALVLLAIGEAEARPRLFRGGGSSFGSPMAGHSNRTAQDTANENAARGSLKHLGGHPGMYEGLGMASTPEKAYAICCYANDRSLTTVDVGYAKGRNGMWFCCRRYKKR